MLCAWPAFARFFRLRPHDVDRGVVQVRLDMRCVIFFDHLDAGAAVFGDLVDVGAFHQAETYICVPQAVRRSRLAFTGNSAGQLLLQTQTSPSRGRGIPRLTQGVLLRLLSLNLHCLLTQLFCSYLNLRDVFSSRR